MHAPYAPLHQPPPAFGVFGPGTDFPRRLAKSKERQRAGTTRPIMSTSIGPWGPLGPPQSDIHSHLALQHAIQWPASTTRRSGQQRSLAANNATYLALCWLLGIISSWCPPMAADAISRVSSHVDLMTWWSASLTCLSRPCSNRTQYLFRLLPLPRGRSVLFDTHSGSSVDIGVRSKHRGTQVLVGKQGRVSKGGHVRREAGEERRGSKEPRRGDGDSAVASRP